MVDNRTLPAAALAAPCGDVDLDELDPAGLMPERVKSMGAILSKAAWKLTRAQGGPDERTDGRLDAAE